MSNDYSVRYGQDYFKRVDAAITHHKKMHGGKCVCCLTRQAKQMHHLSYGNDRFGYNWMPTCVKCHRNICHHPKNWIRLKGKAAIWGNHNKYEFAEKLRRNYKTLAQKD